ncbi:BMC domain-containing protein [bacterium]|nr:BMC domain-containing protein [bacterium]
MEMNSIGLVECSSIALGYVVQDAMLKAADVQLILARTICSGKYLVVVGGNVADTAASTEAGAAEAREGLIESRHIPRIHQDIFPAIGCSVVVEPHEAKALGLVETFSATSIIDCADAAAKAADVKLFRVHLAMAIGGKGFFVVTGDVAAVEASVAAGRSRAAEDGILVASVVIPGPSKELFHEFI